MSMNGGHLSDQERKDNLLKDLYNLVQEATASNWAWGYDFHGAYAWEKRAKVLLNSKVIDLIKISNG